MNLMELSGTPPAGKNRRWVITRNIDYKEINHGNLVTLAKFYGVSTDYLLSV